MNDFNVKYSEIEIPSNKKFGYFFTLVFMVIAGYFFVNKSLNFAYIFGTISVIFLYYNIKSSFTFIPQHTLDKTWTFVRHDNKSYCVRPTFLYSSHQWPY